MSPTFCQSLIQKDEHCSHFLKEIVSVVNWLITRVKNSCTEENHIIQSPMLSIS